MGQQRPDAGRVAQVRPSLASTPLTDAVDSILLREARAALVTMTEPRVVVLDDATGLLAVSVADLVRSASVRVHCDSLVAEQAVQAVSQGAGVMVEVRSGLDEVLLAGANLVMLRLPKSLDALDEIAEAVARFADPAVQLLAGGRVKHMTPSMNRVLQGHFGAVRASLGQQKSRVLVAHRPESPGQSRYPEVRHHPDLDLTVCAHGAVFAGTSIDLGTRLLLSHLDMADVTRAYLEPSERERRGPQARTVIDLGCGTGVLAAAMARRLPQAQVLAVDESWAACRSATATAAANGLSGRIDVQRLNLLSGIPEESVDLIVCNPPFHRGSARDTDAAFGMFVAAGAALRAGGELWTVFNSHLPYLNALRRQVGSTQVIGQNPRYSVTRSRR